MKSKNFNEMSTEELVKTKSSMQVITYMLAAVLVVLIAVNIILFMKKGFNASMVVPVALLPILFLNFSNLTKIKKEISSRNI